MTEWAVKHGVSVLNVAGNRESVNPGISGKVREFVMMLVSAMNDK